MSVDLSYMLHAFQPTPYADMMEDDLKLALRGLSHSNALQVVAYLCDTGEAIQGVEDVGRIMHHALNRLEKVVGGVDTERRHRPDIAPAPTPSGHAGSEDVVMSGAIDENVTPAKPPSGKAVEKLGSKEDKQQPVPETEKDSPFYTGSSIFEESRPKRNLKEGAEKAKTQPKKAPKSEPAPRDSGDMFLAMIGARDPIRAKAGGKGSAGVGASKEQGKAGPEGGE